jgi:prolyl-tRNA synthetase
MGGSDSTEFICPSPSGEDLIVSCPECGYAANIEKAMSRLAAVDDSERAGLPAAPEPFATPGVRTIEDLAVQYQAPADQQIKTLVYFLDDVLTLVLLRGDHALNEQKLADATGAVAIRPVQPEEIRPVRAALRSSRTRRCAAGAACSPAPTPTTPTCAAWTSSVTSPWAGGPTCARWQPVTPA